VSIPLCGHLKQDGVPCGSPALHGKKLCYFHHRDHKRTQYAASVIRRADVLGPKLPPMKSLVDILAALHEVRNAIINDRIPPRRAGVILFGLQQAAIPLRKSHRAQN
jgi:hypothetical protein